MLFNTIKLKNYSKVMVEYAAAAALYPGQLLELTSSGTVQKHSGAGKTALPMFAVEDELQGKGITEAYAAGDVVQCWIPGRGDEVYVKLADAENVVIGDRLESNGLGFVRKVVRSNESWESADSQQAKSQYDHHIVGIALEAQDLSTLEGSESSLDANSQFIKMRVI
jgi:hypothetical protein